MTEASVCEVGRYIALHRPATIRFGDHNERKLMSNLDSEKLVLVKTFNNPNHAELARMALEQAGIEASIEGSHQAGLTGVLRIRLFVFEKDKEQALDILHGDGGEN